MTFRPSEDVLDQISSTTPDNAGWVENSVQDNWEHFFHVSEDMQDDTGDSQWMDISQVFINDAEEVKAPDLSELLKNSEKISSQSEDSVSAGPNPNGVDTDQAHTNTSDWQSQWPNLDETNKSEKNETTSQKTNPIADDIYDENKLTDEERREIVWSIEWAIHTDLDLLVNKEWWNIVEKYKKIHYIVFRWGVFWLASLIWIILWVVMQTSFGFSKNNEIISGAINQSWWTSEQMPDTVLSGLQNNWVSVVVPYGSAEINGNTFQSKSNLISYDGIVLPQLAHLNYNNKLISLEDFYNQSVDKEDLKKVLQILVMNNSIYSKTKTLLSPMENRRVGLKFASWDNEDPWLIKWFNLWCLDTHKASDFFCNKFLDIFYENGKYYDLDKYSSEVLTLTTKIRKQHKDISKVCNMINEYVQHTWKWASDNLNLVMEYCDDDAKNFYKKMINFIDVENSLSQPEISDKVYEDPDLNAYKLLSAQQTVYKILNGNINKNYISSYLKFVKALINKDKWTSTYIAPIYKDMTYIFNMDELNDKLLKKGQLSSEIKSQIDSINNGNSLDPNGRVSLINLVTTKSIIQTDSDFAEYNIQIFTAKDLFAQYYSMVDKLKIRSENEISDDEIRVQTEIISDKIIAVTWGDPIRATINLYRKDNVLNVSNINIARQPELSEILNIRVEDGISFYAMLSYIDDQIWFWYDDGSSKSQEKQTICKALREYLWENETANINVCEDNNIVISRDNIEYRFSLINGILDSFDVGDSELDLVLKNKLSTLIFSRDNTLSVIKSILDYKLEEKPQDDVENKMQVVDQFRIYMKLIPDVYDIEWKSNEFIVEFVLWEFDLQALYNIDTHMLTNISYIACDKILEIEDFTIQLSADNSSTITELLNNPRIFLVRENRQAYEKYLKMCEKEE